VSDDDIPHRLRDRARHSAALVGSLVKAGAKRAIRRSDSDDRALGEALLGELDQMKGLAMKVGQILSYLDALPDETQAALGRLQAGVTPVAFETIRATVERSLGAPLGELFERFDEQAVAAASIGQVHRARHAGAEVAVKVRYPSVARTFDADLRQLRRIASVASLATVVDGQAIVDELAARLREECDYAAEARAQTAFGRAWAGDPSIVVPEVVGARSTDEVLTTAWFAGESFQGLCATGSPERRSLAGVAMARFSWRNLFEHRALHADPHPGNFLFEGDRVCVLDFGCVRRFERPFVDAWRDVFRAVLDGRRDVFVESVRRTGMVGSPKFDFDAHWELVAYSLEPYRRPGFRFTREYVAEAARFSGPRASNQRRMNVPPAWIWLARMQFGLHAVLARLGAEGDFAGPFRQALDAPDAPLEP